MILHQLLVCPLLCFLLLLLSVSLLHQLLLVCPLLCFLLLLLSVSLLAPEEDIFCRKRLCTIVSLCFVALVSTFPQIFSTMLEIRQSVLSHRRQTHASRMVIRWFVHFREVFGTVLPSPNKKRIQNETNKRSRQTKQATKQSTTYAQTRSDQTKTDIQKQRRQQYVSI